MNVLFNRTTGDDRNVAGSIKLSHGGRNSRRSLRIGGKRVYIEETSEEN